MPAPDGLLPPVPLEGRQTYPPIRWWPLRVMNPWHKFAVLIAMFAVNAALWALQWAALPGSAGDIIGWAASTALLIAVARSFRGAGEPIEAPRPWWRLTARPLAGWWLAGLHLLALVDAVLHEPRDAGEWFGVATTVLLGVAFLNSSIRLTALRRSPQV